MVPMRTHTRAPHQICSQRTSGKKRTRGRKVDYISYWVTETILEYYGTTIYYAIQCIGYTVIELWTMKENNIRWWCNQSIFISHRRALALHSTASSSFVDSIRKNWKVVQWYCRIWWALFGCRVVFYGESQMGQIVRISRSKMEFSNKICIWQGTMLICQRKMWNSKKNLDSPEKNIPQFDGKHEIF